MRDRVMRDGLAHVGRGLLMGSADIVPGVSGGTVALIVGIYDRLVASVGSGARAVAALARLGGRQAAEHLRLVEWSLVVPLALGIVLALALGSMLIPPLLEAYPEATSAVFFGLIVASIPLPWGRIGRRRPALVAIVAAGALAAFVLSGLPPRELSDPSLALVFVSAMVALCAMILPGVSGSYLLLVFGIYASTLQALRTLDVAYLATFVAGGALGLGLFSRALDHLLAHRHDVTMAALVGLMLGALRALWPWQTEDRDLLAVPLETSTLATAGFALAAFVVLRLLIGVGARAASRPANQRAG